MAAYQKNILVTQEVENLKINLMTFSITTLIVLVAAIAPHAITTAPKIAAPIVTPASQNFTDNNVINQINTLTAAPTFKVTSTPTATPTPAPTPRRRGSGSQENAAVSGDTSYINIDDHDNKIKYHNFNKGDPWNITLLNIATNALAYQFNDTIGEPDTENNWFVWLGNIYPNEQHGIQKCIFSGNYSVYASASHNGIIIEKKGDITVNSSDACRFPPVPATELNPIILILTGLLGILLVSRKRGNFS